MSAPAVEFSTATVVGHEASIRNAQFLPGSIQILSNATDGEMRLWDFAQPDLLDAARPTCVQAFDHYNNNYRRVRITADGRLAIIYGHNWTQIWNLRLGGWFSDLTGQDEEFLVLAKGETLMVTEANWRHGGLRIWDLRRGRPIATLQAPREKISPRYHPAMEDMTEDEIDAHTPTARITNVTSIGDNKLAVSTENYRTMLFDLDRLKLVRNLSSRVTLLHDDGHTAFSAGSSPDLTAFDLFDDPVAKVNMDQALDCYGLGKIACLADGRVVTTNQTTIRIWRPGDWTCGRTIAKAHAVPRSENATYASINHLVVLPDGQHFATATLCDRPKVWNPDKGSKVAMAISANARKPHCTDRLKLHPLGLIGEVSNVVHLWNPRTGQVLWATPASHRFLDVAPDGRVACANGNQLVIFTPGVSV